MSRSASEKRVGGLLAGFVLCVLAWMLAQGK